MQSIDEIEKQILAEQLSIWRWKTWGICLFLPIFFIAISYHFLMLSHFGYRAFESLPTISGRIEKLGPCHRQRTGKNSSALFQNVTIQNEFKQSTTILIPCLQTFPEQLTGLPITAWQENYLFPTFQSKPIVGLQINGRRITEPFNKLRAKPDDILLFIQMSFIVISLLAIPLAFYNKRKIISACRQLALDKVDAAVSLRSSLATIPNVVSTTIPTELVAPVNRYGDTVYQYTVYVKTVNDTYWKFESNGKKHKFIPIEPNIAKIKKLKLHPISSQESLPVIT